VLDREGVGALMKQAIAGGRKTRPGIKLGICGEHGGDPSSVEFCHELGLDYVSCSPYRVPIARLAAAHGVLAEAGSSSSLPTRKVSGTRAKTKKAAMKTTKTKSAQRPRSRSRVTRKKR
jgi:pyruvate,orthophosphate dikinase